MVVRKEKFLRHIIHTQRVLKGQFLMAASLCELINFYEFCFGIGSENHKP